jgi:hypothetical protein
MTAAILRGGRVIDWRTGGATLLDIRVEAGERIA